MGAARGISAGIKEENDGLTFEVGEGDRLAVLILQREVLYDLVDLHKNLPAG